MEDLTGKVFGRLTVVCRAEKQVLPSGAKVMRWKCVCACGNYKDVPAYNLKIGKTKSCGCLSAELARDRRTKHGATSGHKREKLYSVWRGMKERCDYPKSINYKNYGARGICVCSEWADSYEAFKAWALGAGYEDGLTIDRIDGNKGYMPDNCRWVTRKQQNNNTRHNTLITAYGETKTLAEWGESSGIDASVISARINRLGWTCEDAVSKPIRKIKGKQ